GGVDDAGEGVFGGDGVQDCGELVAVGDVAGGDGDLGAEGGQVGAQGVGVGGVGALPADQDQVVGGVVGEQVACDEGTEGAGAAGDQDRALGVRGSGDREDDLAGVPGLAHPPEGFGGAGDVPALYWRWCDLVLGEEVDEF